MAANCSGYDHAKVKFVLPQIRVNNTLPVKGGLTLMTVSTLQPGCGAAPNDPGHAALERLWLSSGDCYLEHHPGWARLNARSAGARLHTFTASQSGEIDSYTLVREGRGGLAWMMGEICLHQKPVERLNIVGGMVFANGLGPVERRDQASGLLVWLAREARGRPVFLQSLRPDLPLAQSVRSGKHPFMVVSHGSRQQHFVIDLPRSATAFYEGLGYKTRKSVRYSLRKLEEGMSGHLALKCFSTPAQVGDFLDHAIPISEKTYQYRLLGMGLRDRNRCKAEFGDMAESGWWRGYILYCKDEPAAFIYGYLVGNTLYYWDIGYDPKWSQWSVGTVATLKLIETLIAADDGPDRLDFLYGYQDYKRRFSNRSWEEESIFLFPHSLSNFFIAHSLQATNMVSDTAGRVLNRYKLKSRVKRFFRRRAING